MLPPIHHVLATFRPLVPGLELCCKGPAYRGTPPHIACASLGAQFLSGFSLPFEWKQYEISCCGPWHPSGAAFCWLFTTLLSLQPAKKGVCWLDTAELDTGVLSCTRHPHGGGCLGRE